MQKIDAHKLHQKEVRPGFTGRFLHCQTMTLAQWQLKKDAILENHNHPHEQITFVIAGKMHFKTDNDEITLISGEGAVFAPHENHSGTVLEDSFIIDIFSPVREDFKEE